MSILFPLRMSSWYYITAHNGLVLDIHSSAKGGKLILYHKHGGDNQLWRFQDGLLVSKAGLVADVEGSNTNHGASICAWDRHSGLNQKFHQINDTIVSNLQGFVFDVKDGNMAANAEVILWPAHGGSNQAFHLYKA